MGAGGAQRQIVEIAIGYKELGYDVLFLIYQKEYSDYYFSVLGRHDISIMDINETNYIKRIYKVRRIIRSYIRPDVVVAFLENASFMAEIAGFPRRKWKLIVGERSADPRKLRNLKLILFIWFHLFADYIVANSKANIDIVKRICPFISKSKCRVIYNLLNRENFKNIDSIKSNNSKRHLVIASSHRYLKNLNGLVEGINLLHPDVRSNIMVDWYGSNKFDDSLSVAMSKIKDYGLENIFIFHEPTMDIYSKMSEADAIGLFSHFEGFPNALCEGMALSKPVISTKVSDIPSLIKDEYNGFLCDSDDPISISEALYKFLTASYDTLIEMGNRNKELSDSLFNKDRVLKQYEVLFD